MKPAPIFLLLGNEKTGPYDYAAIESMLEEKEISLDTKSSIEGMPSWRSLAETMVWSQAKLLNVIRVEFMDMVQRSSAFTLDIRDARVEMRKLFRSQNILTANTDMLGIVLSANELLLRRHREFIKQDQGWEADAIEAFPAKELTPFSALKFPRDWRADWQNAGGTLSAGRMIARKDHAVWLGISDFGFPFEPFSLDPGMGVIDVSYDEVKSFGLVTLQDVIKPDFNIKPFNLVGL